MWAALHLIPGRMPQQPVRWLCFGLLASLVHLLVVFPSQHDGYWGKRYGRLTWLPIVITDQAWAWTSGLVYTRLRRRIVDALVPRPSDQQTRSLLSKDDEAYGSLINATRNSA